MMRRIILPIDATQWVSCFCMLLFVLCYIYTTCVLVRQSHRSDFVLDHLTTHASEMIQTLCKSWFYFCVPPGSCIEKRMASFTSEN